MKKAIFLGLIGMMLPMLSYGQERVEEIEKIYIRPTQVAIVDQGIFAFVKDQWEPVAAVHVDAVGLYVLGVAHYPYTRWVCRSERCNYNNDGNDTTCQRWDCDKQKYCGAPRPPG